MNIELPDNLEALTLRGIVLLKLGGKCSECGWERDLRVLEICRVNGSDEETRRTKSRQGHYLAILAQAGSGKWKVLCRNCKGTMLFERAAAAAARRAPSEPPVFVWKANLPAADVVGVRFAWIDEQVAKGCEAYVETEEGVFKYLGITPVASCLEELAMDQGWGELPKEESGFVERR